MFLSIIYTPIILNNGIICQTSEQLRLVIEIKYTCFVKLKSIGYHLL